MSRGNNSFKLVSQDEPISYTTIKEAFRKDLRSVGVDPSTFGFYCLCSRGATSAGIMGLVTVCFSSSTAGSPSFHLSFRPILCHSTYFVGLVLAKPFQNKLICHYFLSVGVVYWSQNMLFLTNEPGKKAEINILPARDTTGPGY